MNRDTFFDQLRESGLLTGQIIDEAAARFPDTVQGKAITRVLVADGLLTPFQAKKLLAGKGKSLHLGPYRILDQLGRGATGAVFKAMHRTMGRFVAIKVVHPGVLEDSAILDLFWREVRAVTQLHHPGIAMAYDAGVAKGRPFLVMEYVDGPSLERLVQAYGPLPVALVCELMRQASGALQYAHEQGMVHRDIKPANLLIAYPPGALSSEKWEVAFRPVLKIIDFGLARLRRAGMASRRCYRPSRAGDSLGHNRLHCTGAGPGYPCRRHSLRSLQFGMHVLLRSHWATALFGQQRPGEARQAPAA